MSTEYSSFSERETQRGEATLCRSRSSWKMELEFEIKVLKISKTTIGPLQISIGENIRKFGESEY